MCSGSGVMRTGLLVQTRQGWALDGPQPPTPLGKFKYVSQQTGYSYFQTQWPAFKTHSHVCRYVHTHTHTYYRGEQGQLSLMNIPVTCTILETCVRANVHFTLAILTSVEGKYADWLLPFDQANTSTFLNSSTSHIFDYTQIKIQKGLTRLNMPAVTVFEGEAW